MASGAWNGRILDVGRANRVTARHQAGRADHSPPDCDNLLRPFAPNAAGPNQSGPYLSRESSVFGLKDIDASP